MKVAQILECESKQLRKIQNFQLPTIFKTIGIAVTILGMVAIFGVGFFIEDAVSTKLLIKKVMLIGLLCASISRDTIEDELSISLRSQSYALAFVMAVVYAIIQPEINHFVGNLFSNGKGYVELSSFEVLWFMLVVQLCIFTLLKKVR